MLLESLGNTNIADFNLEEPKKPIRLEFDPDKDILAIDWEMTRGQLRIAISVEDRPYVIVEHAAEIKLLSPAKLGNLPLNGKFLENFLRDFKNIKVTDVSPEHPDNFVRNLKAASHLKLLFPEQTKDHLVESGINALLMVASAEEAAIFYAIHDQHPDIYLDMLAAATILVGHNGPDQTIFFDLYKRYNQITKRPNLDRFVEDPTEAENLAKLRIIFPDFNPKINPHDWDILKKTVVARSTQVNFIKYALALKILAAKEVRVSEEGLELVMTDPGLDLVPAIPPIPETRKF
ncbi:MAG: hypothetical protein Q7R49_02240 [Candidatus Daviesbacteria bacterium]|nr:hypothetical protein [Candidatus Daviesbacteria bacterium]